LTIFTKNTTFRLVFLMFVCLVESDRNELVLPFRSENFGVEKTESGPQIITEGDGASTVEESFYVTNR
jgi:hypothetical protein